MNFALAVLVILVFGVAWQPFLRWVFPDDAQVAEVDDGDHARMVRTMRRSWPATVPTDECPFCDHARHDGEFCQDWVDLDRPETCCPHECACSYPDPRNYTEVPERSEAR